MQKFIQNPYPPPKPLTWKNHQTHIKKPTQKNHQTFHSQRIQTNQQPPLLGVHNATTTNLRENPLASTQAKKKLKIEESKGSRRIRPAYCTWWDREEWRPCEWDHSWEYRRRYRWRRSPTSTSQSCWAHLAPERRSSRSKMRRRCWSSSTEHGLVKTEGFVRGGDGGGRGVEEARDQRLMWRFVLESHRRKRETKGFLVMERERERERLMFKILNLVYVCYCVLCSF